VIMTRDMIAEAADTARRGKRTEFFQIPAEQVVETAIFAIAVDVDLKQSGQGHS